MKQEIASFSSKRADEILRDSTNNTMRSQNDLEELECSCKMPQYADWRDSTLLSLLNNAELDQTNCMSDGMQKDENREIVLMKLSPAEEHQNMTPELNSEVCFPSKAEGSSVDVLESDTTETSNSVTVLSQSSRQILSLDVHSQSETESSSSSSSQALTNTRSSSHDDPISTTSLNTATGLQMSGHNDNSSTGARPKLIASRTLKKNSRPKNKHKHVTWSEEKKYVTFVDAVTYEHYRNCILNFPLPDNCRSSAAVGAVLFMREKDEKISQSLIDIALKFLWVKLGFCPKAVPLYTTICDFNYDERSFVLAFLELCQTEPSRTVANALFGNIQSLMSSPLNTNPASLHRRDETDNIPLQAFNSIPEQNNMSNSLTVNSNSLTENSNSLTENSNSLTENRNSLTENRNSLTENRKSLTDNSNSLTENSNSLTENRNSLTDNSNSLTDNSNSLTENRNSLTDNKSVINSRLQTAQVFTDEPLKALDFNIPQTISPHSHENLQPPCEVIHPVSHIYHATSTPDNDTFTKQQRLPLSEKQKQHLQIEVLMREQEYLKNVLTCVLCKNKPAEVTLLPCGHFVLCAACSDDCNICPVCKKEALAEVKTFLC